MFSVEFFPSKQEAREWIDRNVHLIKIAVYSDEPGIGTAQKFRKELEEAAFWEEHSECWLNKQHACVVYTY